MLKQKWNLWDKERIRLLDKRWRVEDEYRRFQTTDPGEYPVVYCIPGEVVEMTAPCCGNSAFHFDAHIHKCAFCGKYYYVMEKENDE